MSFKLGGAAHLRLSGGGRAEILSLTGDCRLADGQSIPERECRQPVWRCREG